MTTLVLFFGLVNLAIGCGLASVLESRSNVIRFSGRFRLGLPRLPRWRRGRSSTSAVEESPTIVVLPVPPVPISTMPRDWDPQCPPAGVTPEAFDEALLWLVIRQVQVFRDQVITCDDECRRSDETQLPFDTIRNIGQDWQRQLDAWVAEATACRIGRMRGDLPSQLDELLLNHSFQIKSAIDGLAPLEAGPHGPAARQAVLREVARAFDAANALRDQAGELLVQILRESNRLQTLPESSQSDPTSESLSRFGIESTWDAWLAKDEDRTRLVSAVLVDVDRMTGVNDRIPLRAADQTLDAFGRMLKTLVRQHRGFDRVARFSGQAYLLFFGDTGLRNAIIGAERIRQAIEATSFRVGQQSIEFTTSCGVAEFGREEAIADFLQRTRRMVIEAKKAGRNRTCFEDGGRTQVAEVSQFMVRGRVLDVESDTSSMPAIPIFDATTPLVPTPPSPCV